MDFIYIGIGIAVLAFFCEYIDSTLGMGYGTTLTPLLLLIGYNPLMVVPAILLSEFITGALAAGAHHRVGNVSFDFKNDKENNNGGPFWKRIYNPKSFDSKVAVILATCSLVGAVVAVLVAVNLPTFYLKLFIGVIVLIMGIIILLRYKATPEFSWNKIVGLGIVAAFNKGLSGGGYGPLVTSGQILSGIKSKSSVAITSFSESFTCLVGILMYLILGTQIDWTLAPFLVGGAVLSVPISAMTVKKVPIEKFTLLIGIATTILGLFTLYKTLM